MINNLEDTKFRTQNSTNSKSILYLICFVAWQP